jgi:hypothetical protein
MSRTNYLAASLSVGLPSALALVGLVSGIVGTLTGLPLSAVVAVTMGSFIVAIAEGGYRLHEIHALRRVQSPSPPFQIIGNTASGNQGDGFHFNIETTASDE